MPLMRAGVAQAEYLGRFDANSTDFTRNIGMADEIWPYILTKPATPEIWVGTDLFLPSICLFTLRH